MELESETPATSISVTRLGVPLVLVISSIIAAATAWGAIQVSHAKLDATILDVAELKTQTLPTAVEMQHVKDRLDGVEASLERIENKLGTK